MSLFKKVTDFATSQQGRNMLDKAKKYAQDPKNKEKIDQVKNKIMGKDDSSKDDSSRGDSSRGDSGRGDSSRDDSGRDDKRN